MFDVVLGAMMPHCMHDFTLMRHVAFQIHYNVDNGRASIYAGWMYKTGVVLAGGKRTARTFVRRCV